MKHASAQAIATLESLLRQLRVVPGLVEPSVGSFYRKGVAFVHFHEDPAGLFADLKRDGKNFERFRVSSPDEQAAFVAVVLASAQL